MSVVRWTTVGATSLLVDEYTIGQIMESESGDIQLKKRVQLSLHSLLILIAVLGPLSGWYGQIVFAQEREICENTPKAESTTVPTEAQIFERKAMYREAAREAERLDQIRREKIQPSLDRIESHRLKREAYRRERFQDRGWSNSGRSNKGGRNPRINSDGTFKRINSDGTFNMQFHLPPSGQ